MIFDLICVITILGLAVKGIKEVLTNKIAVVLSLLIALFVSTALLPIYMKFIHFPSFIPSNIFAFILTFIFSYILMALPSLILSVILGGSLIILLYGIIIKFLPSSLQTQLVQNSIIFSFIRPIVEIIFKWVRFFI